MGQGISLATGVALGKSLQGKKGNVYAILGDGELQEGQNWEAFQFIAHKNIRNLITLIDNNGRQLDDYTDKICNPFSMKDKLTAFGFDVQEVNGHDVKALYEAIIQAQKSEKPAVVICNTEKGYGCNFAEIKGFNHYMEISAEAAESAIAEIDRRLEESYELIGG